MIKSISKANIAHMWIVETNNQEIERQRRRQG